MRTRHRIPSVFNLSMVDVLCCALGCVILLWLVNFREAKRRSAINEQTTAELAEKRGKLDLAAREADDLRTRLSATDRALLDTEQNRAAQEAQAAALMRDKDKLQADLDQLRTRYAQLDKEKSDLKTASSRAQDELGVKTKEAAAIAKELATLKTESVADRDRLAKKTQDYQALVKERDTASKELTALQKLLADKETLVSTKAKELTSLQKLLTEKEALASAAAKSATDLTTRLQTAELKSKILQTQADMLATRDKELETAKGKTVAAEARLATLQQDVTTQKTRADRAELARMAAENRFAGIHLTGKRVVFLVDMSGSMRHVDEKTPAPDKWKGVCDTVGQISRSLPELEKFQVILFSDKISYPLGSDGRWLTFDAKGSAATAVKALTDTKPQGPTNMYAPFEAAFRLRADGLDTIYVLSDGLPNVGPGLPANEKSLKETERGEILGNHIRKALKTDWNKPIANRPRVRINTVGFFYESPDVGAFLWALARENDGSFVGMSKP